MVALAAETYTARHERPQATYGRALVVGDEPYLNLIQNPWQDSINLRLDPEHMFYIERCLMLIDPKNLIGDTGLVTVDGDALKQVQPRVTHMVEDLLGGVRQFNPTARIVEVSQQREIMLPHSDTVITPEQAQKLQATVGQYTSPAENSLALAWQSFNHYIGDPDALAALMHNNVPVDSDTEYPLDEEMIQHPHFQDILRYFGLNHDLFRKLYSVGSPRECGDTLHECRTVLSWIGKRGITEVVNSPEGSGTVTRLTNIFNALSERLAA